MYSNRISIRSTDCDYGLFAAALCFLFNLLDQAFRAVQRNSSLNLTYVADQLASLKGVDRETVEKVTWDNARKLYRLEP